MFATRLAQSDPDRFAAIATHAGFAKSAALTRSAEAKSDEARGRSVPIYLQLGEQDHIFSVSAARESGNAMVRAGNDVQLVIYDGHNHWYYTAAPAINRYAWGFLRKHL